MAETAHVETLASGKELARSISPENVSRHDPVLEARLRHKFDRRIMPLGIIIFLVAQIDRSNMGNAKILGNHICPTYYRPTRTDREVSRIG